MSDSPDNKPENAAAETVETVVEDAPVTSEAPVHPSPEEQFEALREKATQAFKAGAADAKEALLQRLPQVKEDVARGLGDIAYAIGYSFSFGSALIRQFSDESILNGFEKGSEAGAKAAETTFKSRQETAEKPDEPDPPSQA